MSIAAISVTSTVSHAGLPAPGAGLGAVSLSPAEAETQLGAYRGGVYAYLRRRGFSAEEADDLTQETLIRAYTHLSGFRGTSLGAWLYRIAANVSVDYLRKQRLVTLSLDAPVDGAAGPGVAGIPAAEEPLDMRLCRDEDRKYMQSVISLLPECHQRVLLLRYYEECSLAEISAALNCSPMAAKLRVFRAVSALRKRWRTQETLGPRETMEAV